MLHFSRFKIAAILMVVTFGIIYALPNLFSRQALEGLPGWVPSQKLQLGLDLQGGSHLLLEMNSGELRADWLEGIRDDVRIKLRAERIGYTGLRATNSDVRVTIREPEKFDAALAAVRELAQPLEGNLFSDTTGTDIQVSRGEGTVIVISLTDQAFSERVRTAVGAAIETVRRRIDALGTTEPNIQRQGDNRILVQVPGLNDPAQLKAVLGQTAKLSFHLVDQSMPVQEAVSRRPPPGSEIYEGLDPPGSQYLLIRRAIVSGEDLVDAQPGFDQRTSEPIVTFRFNSSGARRFGQATADNVGRPFAILLDDKVISAPVIREPILGGTGQISGSFSVAEATNLSILLRSGALPASLDIIEERSIGPSLGADSIAAGEIAGLIGLIGVLIFMLICYGLFGIFANIALIVNLALIMGILSALQATLTLPGIAGIVLTVGMAVDANVLIFERIREELATGKTPVAAVDIGFSRALGTILDASITTFIAALILFLLGSGPIRGFAVTLSIGIFTSVFTAFMVTRLIVALWIRRYRPAIIPI
jgi:preprotein translocase subunit SecD